MPKPFIILEDHNSFAARKFITDNISVLKQLGYRKFLLEMDKEVLPNVFKKQLRTFVADAAFNAANPSIEPLLRLFEALEAHNIPYEFIDPETQRVAYDLSQRVAKASTASEVLSLHQLRDHLTKLRDDTMAAEITKQARCYAGGVFFLGGYQHKRLVQLLAANSSFSIFTDSRSDRPSKGMELLPIGALQSERARQEFYHVHVNYFDLAHRLSFEQIEAEAGLTQSVPCTPSVGKYLKEMTGQEYSCVIDDHSVVSAHTTIATADLETAVITLKTNFPGLRFFTNPRGASTVLTIPGVNLAETQVYFKK